MREIKPDEDPYLHEKFWGKKKGSASGCKSQMGQDIAVLTHSGLLSEKTFTCGSGTASVLLSQWTRFCALTEIGIK